ncbi:MAG: 4Fe-4S dicluster domain-containing protein [Candidatus Melainabacteria bacterium]|nr:4Fe-4S dicluster domain-containing protein [Candidatus Melainabacteria bacterium]
MEKCFYFWKKDFGEFLSRLRSMGSVYAPVRVSDQSFAFRSVRDEAEIAFEALRTILPPKKFFYPAKETILECDGDEVKEHIEVVEPFAVFGVHPCDLAGLNALDKIFLSTPQDSHYQRRRRAAFIIGLSCLPDKHCFCKAMKADAPSKGYDLFLTDLEDKYFVQVNNQDAFDFVLSCKEFMHPTKDEDNQGYKKFWNDRDLMFEHNFDSAQLPNLMDLGWDHPLWQELGERCLSCGNCTPVCPTCYCFDMTDVAMFNSEKVEAERQRVWDSCQFSGFAAVAGGENFRPGPVDRLKFWYRHKLHGFEDPIEIPSCVGCGRCTVSCPSGIDDLPGVIRILAGRPQLNLEGEIA